MIKLAAIDIGTNSVHMIASASVPICRSRSSTARRRWSGWAPADWTDAH